jgi:hypothetical protein
MFSIICSASRNDRRFQRREPGDRRVVLVPHVVVGRFRHGGSSPQLRGAIEITLSPRDFDLLLGRLRFRLRHSRLGGRQRRVEIGVLQDRKDLPFFDACPFFHGQRLDAADPAGADFRLLPRLQISRRDHHRVARAAGLHADRSNAHLQPRLDRFGQIEQSGAGGDQHSSTANRD